jgi:hypothetical protein
MLTAALVAGALAAFDWDATVFVSFGSTDPSREFAEQRLGEVVLRGELGHDGKFFFVQANDPWLLDPSNHAEILDFPVYRSQRMVYPLLAGGFGLFGPEAVVWGLLVVNVVAMAVGTLGAARLARSLGGSPWWGLAFPANLGFLYALTIDSGGVVAAAFAIWAVAFLYENRLRPGIALLAASALTREVMLISAAGIAVWLWSRDQRRQALYVAGVPALALGIWEIYIRIRLGPDPHGVDALGLPLVGLLRAIPGWLDDPITLAAGACIVAFILIYVIRWWNTRSLLGWAFLGFVPLALMMTEKVWTLIFDFTRAVAPLMTATLLLVFVEGKRRRVASSEDLTTATGSRS